MKMMSAKSADDDDDVVSVVIISLRAAQKTVTTVRSVHRAYFSFVLPLFAGLPWSAALAAEAVAREPVVSPALEVITVIGAPKPTVGADAFIHRADQRLLLDEDALRRDGVERLSDLDGYDPRLIVVEDRGRSGISDIRMRGLGGNRILVSLDGIPLADDLAGRDFVDPLLLSSVAADFGPGSSRYGSDALAGRLEMRSLAPDDVVDGGHPWYAQGRVGGSSFVDALSLHGRLAHLGAGHAWLVAGTAQQSHEPQAVGAAQIPEQEIHTGSVLTALRVTFAQQWSAIVTIDGFTETADSVFVNQPLIQRTGDDERYRGRVSLEQRVGEVASPWLRNLLYVQQTNSEEVTRTSDFATTPENFTRTVTSLNQFRQTVVGSNLHLITALEGNSNLVWGGDARYTQSEDIQRSTTTLLTPPGSLSSDPTRSFPISQAFTGGLFGEWNQRSADDRWGISLGPRIDVYALDVTIDEAYETSLAGQSSSTDLRATAPTMRAAVDWSPRAGSTGHAKVASGYRNGRYDEANQAFTNFTNGYTISPNPDLAAEQSLGVEAGWRESSDLSVELTGHYTWYRDFIETAYVGTVPNVSGIGPFATLAQYQAVNRARVDIYGVDLIVDAQLGESWFARAAVSWVDGRDHDTGETIRQLDPLAGLIGIGWLHQRTGLRVETIARGAMSKRGIEDDSFVPASWVALDLRVIWMPNENLRFDMAWINVSNRTYWRWADVNQVRASDPQATKDFYAAEPGYLTAAATFTF